MMNNKQEIYETLVAILSKEFELEPESITMEVNLYQELGLDSIDAVDLIVRLQELIGKRIDPEVFKQVRTVGDVVSAIDTVIHR